MAEAADERQDVVEPELDSELFETEEVGKGVQEELRSEK
jgi:hypothetical protein